jgi:putative DNA primase/helicase
MPIKPAILDRLRGVQRAGAGWLAFCPAHNDQNKRSLSVGVGDDGKTLLKCHAAGCTAEQITAAVSMSLADLAGVNGHQRARRREIAAYEYTDERGALLYQAVRYEPKDFRCRRPDGAGGWLWNLEGVRVVPHRLRELAEASRVFNTEGEKDSDALGALGLIATCNHGGAGKWRSEHTDALVAAAVPEVVIVPDNDPAGEAHARSVAQSCHAAGLRVKVLALPELPPKGDVSDWLAAGHTANELEALADAAPIYTPDAAAAPASASASVATIATSVNGVEVASDYIEPIGVFLAEEDAPTSHVFPGLLPCGVIMLMHGEPRARKSLTALELALAAATGTAPFGLARLTPTEPITVLYLQEEDPRALTRPRLRVLVEARCGDARPDTLYVAVRRGVDLDDPVWVARLIDDLRRLGVKLLVLDAARRLSAKTDEGPTKVRELIAVLRSIVTDGGVTIVIVHHDVKPPQNGAQDPRRRGQRASGGDWFAGCECPVHVERVGKHESLVFPEDYKFSADPAPFTFTCEITDGLVTRLVGVDTTTEHAERVGVRGKVLDWLRANGPATRTDLKKAGIAQWPAIEAALDLLMKDGKVDAAPGRKAGSLRYFVIGEPSTANSDGSPVEETK